MNSNYGRFSGSRRIILGGRQLPATAKVDFVLHAWGRDFEVIDTTPSSRADTYRRAG